MLYTCSPAMPHAMRVAAKRSRRGAAPRRHFTIDIHCHVVSPEAERVAQPSFRPDYEPMVRHASDATREVNRKQGETIRDQITSVKARLAAMDKLGIDMQAISPAPPQYYYWAPPDLARQTSRIVNDNIAQIVAGHPDRFVGLGTVPLQAPELAVAELERMVKELDLRGVEICTNVAGAELSEPRFRPFFAKAEELGILIFMHPNGFSEGRRLSEHYFINIIGNPLDSTVAVSHLIFGGVLDAYPRLKICVAHGGGFLPAYSGRSDHGHGARSDARSAIKRDPTSYLKKLYFDSIVFTHHQLEYLAEVWGSDHILLGSDYPFDMAEPDPVGFIAGAKRLSGDDKAAIMGRNAAKLLKIRIPAATQKKRK
ncbi:MAG TPA: amidohydrolase family protein [Stellaceae bacterium]|nr:amidohydrolase family protein [Stellaceae bacterium]